MELSEINAILKDIPSIRQGVALETKEIDDDTHTEVYKVSSDLHVRIKLFESSYTENGPEVVGIEFVEPQEKTITTYESI